MAQNSVHTVDSSVQCQVTVDSAVQCQVTVDSAVQCNVRYYCVECRKTTAGGGSEQVYQSTEYSVQCTVQCTLCRL